MVTRSAAVSGLARNDRVAAALPLARTAGLMQNVVTGANARRRLALLDVSRTAGLGLNLRRVRTEKGLTLDRLASLSELTRGYISLVERGLKVPSIAALLRLAKALDVSVAYLFDPNSAQAPRYTIYRQREQGAGSFFHDRFQTELLLSYADVTDLNCFRFNPCDP